jgi:hypothetical protein
MQVVCGTGGSPEVHPVASRCTGAHHAGKDGLVRITLKRAFSDGTIAIDLDPLSLLSRLAAAVPYPRFHTVRYSGVLASASKLRPMIAPKQEPVAVEGKDVCVHSARECEAPKRGPYRPWASRPSCQPKHRQGGRPFGNRARSEDESSETKPRSQPHKADAKTSRQGERMSETPKCDLGNLRAIANAFLHVPKNFAHLRLLYDSSNRNGV